MQAASFWRRGSYILVLLLLITYVFQHINTGYPGEWHKVQIGMPASQVRALCGEPTHSSGMGPDVWEHHFLFGKWVLEIASGDYAEDPQNIVYAITVFYEHPLAWKDLVLRSEHPPIQAYAAFMQAFGLKPDPNRQYRIVLPPTSRH